MNAGDKVEAKAGAFTATPIAFREDTKHFEPANDAFDMETQMSWAAVNVFFLTAQRMNLVCRCQEVD